MIKVGLISLGCAKNLVDSEIMVGHLHKAGMAVIPDAENADVVIVNTCSFIDSSKEESIGHILEVHRQRGLRKKRRDQKLIVAGCMSQRFSKDLPGSMPEVDAFIGLDQITRVAPIIEEIFARERGSKVPPASFVTPRSTFIPDYDTPRFRLTPAHFAYVKIAEGCNHPCTFCIIPQIRGRHRSRTVARACRPLGAWESASTGCASSSRAPRASGTSSSSRSFAPPRRSPRARPDPCPGTSTSRCASFSRRGAGFPSSRSSRPWA